MQVLESVQRDEVRVAMLLPRDRFGAVRWVRIHPVVASSKMVRLRGVSVSVTLWRAGRLADEALDGETALRMTRAQAPGPA